MEDIKSPRALVMDGGREMAETVKKAAGENVGIPAVGVVFKKPVGDSRLARRRDPASS